MPVGLHPTQHSYGGEEHTDPADAQACDQPLEQGVDVLIGPRGPNLGSAEESSEWREDG
jgi:hypothetical protein